MDEIVVYIAMPLGEDHLQRIQMVSPQLNVTYLPDDTWAHGSAPYEPPPKRLDYLKDAEVLLDVFAFFEMQQAPNLRWLQVPGAGVEKLRGTPVMESDVIITNARIFATPIAEYVFASILAYCRHLPKAIDQVQKQAVWPRNVWNEYLGIELEGKTMAIIGYGSTGHRLGQLARCFGMRAIATRRNLKEPVVENGVHVFPADHLIHVLSQADFVVISLPLTRETEGIIGERALRAMKPNAYLVNVGRGRLIQNEPLLRALTEGWIGGAGLDVHDPTPPPEESPFRELPNVIMTPHMAGVTSRWYDRVTDLFCENLRRYIHGAPLLHVIDKELGY